MLHKIFPNFQVLKLIQEKISNYFVRLPAHLGMLTDCIDFYTLMEIYLIGRIPGAAFFVKLFSLLLQSQLFSYFPDISLNPTSTFF